MKKYSHKNSFKRFSNYELMGGYIKRFHTVYIILLFVLAAVELALFIREATLVRSIPFKHYFYLTGYIVLFVTSISSATFLIFERNIKDNERLITIIFHIYAIVGTLWGAGISIMDSMGGGNDFPVVYFTMVAALGGLLVLNPFIYLPVILLSSVGLFVGFHFTDPTFFQSFGNLINFIVLLAIIGVISYHTSAVAVSDEEQRKAIVKMSITDVLTGLKNENAYYRYLDSLNKKEHIEYAVIVMDVNGLKHTDDTYGHRFGAHLISTAGKILPTVFVGAEIFHTGGDEFVCVVTDVANLDNYLKVFEEKLEYSHITFEGQELMLSLARGVSLHKHGEKYNDTYQRADRDMYKNKQLVKTKYNIQGR